jgi:hypothetical protein
MDARQIIGTVSVWRSSADALVDSESRPMKAIWYHFPVGYYAVGDKDDLPEYREDGGNWCEISLADLLADVEDRPRR